MAKKDQGHEETEQRLRELEKRISEEYAKAEKELTDKLDDYMRRFEIKDKLKQEAVQNGLITDEEYKKWRVGQIAMGERWEEMRNTIAQDLTHTAQIAKDLTNGAMPDVYAINHNYGTYQVEKGALVNTSYTLYDRDSVNRLWNDDNTFYKGPGKKLSKDINEGKQLAWDKKEVQSAMIQSLLQGEPIGSIASRLMNMVGDSDRKAAIRNARTITTGIENAGRIDSYKRAEAMGIPMEKEWLATLDGRTRHEHRMLDGMHVPVDEKFEVEGYEIEYPGDPSADDGMVYNCRCTLIARIKDFEHDLSDMDSRISNDEDVGDMTYDEWKESRDIRSDSITKQDDIAETMQRAYNNEYREYAGLNPIYYTSSKPLGMSMDSSIPSFLEPVILKQNTEEVESVKYCNELYDELQKRGVIYNEVKERDEDKTPDEIIDIIGGGDKTYGSCVSVALAYIGQICGLDVKDFRGGESLDVFSDRDVFNKIINIPGIVKQESKARSEITAATKLLKQVQEGKEYLFEAGKHACIVKQEEGVYKYLELQNEKSKWEDFNGNPGNTFYERFGCEEAGADYYAHMAEITSFKNNEGFYKLLGYINTQEGQEKKGEDGYAK